MNFNTQNKILNDKLKQNEIIITHVINHMQHFLKDAKNQNLIKEGILDLSLANSCTKILKKNFSSNFFNQELDNVVVFVDEHKGFLSIRDFGKHYKKKISFDFETNPKTHDVISLTNFKLDYKDKKMRVELREGSIALEQNETAINTSWYVYDYSKSKENTEILINEMQKQENKNKETIKTLIQNYPEAFFEHVLFRIPFSSEIKDVFALIHDVDIDWKDENMFLNLEGFDKNINFEKKKSLFQKLSFK